MDNKELKKKIKEAAKTFNFIFEDTNINGFKVVDDKVIFYEDKKPIFEYSKDEILNDNY